MEQVRVSELALEFDLKHSVVIAELKKIGVWVPSADTPVDHDIADRMRRRLQLMAELEEQEQEKAKEKQEKKKEAPKTKKTIKELGQPRKARKAHEEVEEEEQAAVPLAGSLKPRKGKASYRTVEPVGEQPPQKTEVTIEDEPIIEKVEAQVSAEVLERARERSPAAELKEISEKIEAEKEKVDKERKEAPAVAPRRIRRLRVTPPKAAKIEAVPEEKVERIAEKPVHKAAGAAPEAVAQGAQESAVVEKETKEKLPEVSVPGAAQPAAVEEAEPRVVTFTGSATVKELGEKLGVGSNDLIKELMGRGAMLTVNQALDAKTIEAMCEAHGVRAQFGAQPVGEVRPPSQERVAVEERPEHLVERAPVVTVMGHVDHGKTSLLDAIRHTQVAEGEAGGITQHIGAHHVTFNDRKIVFIDTPGHEAFTRMRARGASVTDLVVLVVAADDGVMPQTLEAIDHARAAEVPILVAINKIDKPEAQPQRVKQALAEQNLVPEDWGGDTVIVEVSAKEKKNLELLLEMILLSADLLELKANPDRQAGGVVLEAKLDRGRGPVATVLVQSGTLKGGDSLVSGAAYGKVRAMFDDRGNPLKDAGPTTAVEILGWQNVPQVGDRFEAVEDYTTARQIAEQRRAQLREQELSAPTKISLEELYRQMQEGEVKELNMVLKADTQGSVEVLEDTLQKLGTDKVQVRIIHSGVGAISESDVLLAAASNAIVIGFNVRPEHIAQDAAEQEKVDIRLHTVIYDLTNEIRQAMTGLLEPTIRETDLGRAEVRQTFRVPRFGTIAGSYVLDGVIRRNAHVRLLRDNVVIYEGKIDSLHRFKDDVNEVKAGYECGISIANFNDVKVGDVIEAFVKEEVAPTLQ